MRTFDPAVDLINDTSTLEEKRGSRFTKHPHWPGIRRNSLENNIFQTRICRVPYFFGIILTTSVSDLSSTANSVFWERPNYEAITEVERGVHKEDVEVSWKVGQESGLKLQGHCANLG